MTSARSSQLRHNTLETPTSLGISAFFFFDRAPVPQTEMRPPHCEPRHKNIPGRSNRAIERLMAEKRYHAGGAEHWRFGRRLRHLAMSA